MSEPDRGGEAARRARSKSIYRRNAAARRLQPSLAAMTIRNLDFISISSSVIGAVSGIDNICFRLAMREQRVRYRRSGIKGRQTRTFRYEIMPTNGNEVGRIKTSPDGVVPSFASASLVRGSDRHSLGISYNAWLDEPESQGPHPQAWQLPLSMQCCCEEHESAFRSRHATTASFSHGNPT